MENEMTWKHDPDDDLAPDALEPGDTEQDPELRALLAHPLDLAPDEIDKEG